MSLHVVTILAREMIFFGTRSSFGDGASAACHDGGARNAIENLINSTKHWKCWECRRCECCWSLRVPLHGCSMHGMPFHLQQWRPGPFPFTLYAVKRVGPLATCFATPVLV